MTSTHTASTGTGSSTSIGRRPADTRSCSGLITHWAGLALVQTGPPADMVEFFVLRKYRRVGLGRRAAAEIFRLFPGEWTVRQQHHNAVATSFWRTAIPYAYRERATADEVIQEFKVDPL